MKVRVLYWAIIDVRRFRSRRRGAATEHDVGTKTPCNSTLAVSVRSVEAGSVTSQEIALHVWWCDSLHSRVDTRVYSHCRHANWTNCLLPRHLGSFTFTQPRPLLCSQASDTGSHTVLFVVFRPTSYQIMYTLMIVVKRFQRTALYGFLHIATSAKVIDYDKLWNIQKNNPNHSLLIGGVLA